MMISSLEQLRSYVADESSSLNQSEHTVRLFVTHSNLNETTFLEIRFDSRWTVRTVKEKLATHCGTNASAMRLQLFHESAPRTTSRSEERCASGKKSQQNVLMTEVSNDDAKLGYYSPLDGMRLHVIDTDPMSVSANGWLEDLSKVEKYVMSDEAYEKREGTYRQWARKKREEDPTWTLQKEQQKLRNQRKSTN